MSKVPIISGYVEDRTLKRHISIGIFVVYIDTGSSVPGVPSKSRDLPFIFDDFHFCRSRVIGLDMTENWIFTLCRYDNLSSVSQNVLKFYQQLTDEERRIPFIFDDFHFAAVPELLDLI